MQHRSPFVSAALLSAASLILPGCAAPSQKVEHAWHTVPDRVWIGPEFWANRLQDWRIRGGRVECVGTSLPYRTLHVTTRRIALDTGTIEMTVRLGTLAGDGDVAPEAAAGFLIGAGAPDLDWRAACIVQSAPGPDGGWFCGVTADGRLVLRDFTQSDPSVSETSLQLAGVDGRLAPLELTVLIAPEEGWAASIEAFVRDPATGAELGRVVRHDVDGVDLAGNLALVSHPAPGPHATGWWFDDWCYAGTRLVRHDAHVVGPIVAAFHTLSRGVLKMSAQLMPVALGNGGDPREVALELADSDGPTGWHEVARAHVDPTSFNALLRVEGWDATRDVRYRLRYGDAVYTGKIRHDPVEKRELVLAVLSCNHNNRHGFGQAGYPWNENALWFPHADLVARLEQQDPDVLFFAGDQIYEGASPTPPDKSGGEASALDYLYKWSMFCLAFGDAARDRPTIVIPDDHDVFQGNLWGAGGRATERDNQGGYVMPAEWVRLVERTQTSHLPDPFDATPVDQGIGVYFTGLVYGAVGFAVLEDRKFKSGCADLALGGPRPDHIVDPEFDVRSADAPGKELLGARQLAFLDAWARDWRGQQMKLALSQTLFANVATNHGPAQDEIVADLDSNGWPQSGRNAALRALRKAFALHVCGDQHLATLVHHGVDAYDDAGWSFTVPAIANFYARAWRPHGPAEVPLPGRPEYAGSRKDGFGNRVTVWAAANAPPATSPTGHEPAALHDQMPGYGIVRVDKRDRTYTVECWPRYADPRNDAQYEGWPKTLTQREQYGRQAVAWLPVLALDGWESPVVQVIDDAGELVYALRVQAARFHPWTFAFGVYDVRVGDPERDVWTTLRLAAGTDTSETVRVPPPTDRAR